LTLNGSDNCTATAPRPCNGLPMLRRGLEVVRLIIIIIIIWYTNIQNSYWPQSRRRQIMRARTEAVIQCRCQENSYEFIIQHAK